MKLKLNATIFAIILQKGWVALKILRSVFCKAYYLYVYPMCVYPNNVVVVGRNNQEVQKGIIPNKARAEELATAQFNATKKELTASESRGSFFRRRRNSHRRSKSLSKVSGIT